MCLPELKYSTLPAQLPDRHDDGELASSPSWSGVNLLPKEALSGVEYAEDAVFLDLDPFFNTKA